MNWYGIVIGIAAFALIGAFHPIVIKVKYYFGARAWPCFLAGGIVALIISFLVPSTLISCIVACAGFCMFWSILELHEQEKRVKKGWFPANPKKKPR